MKPLFDWLRSWRQPKSSKTAECTQPGSSEYVGAGDMHINTSALNKGTCDAPKSHHSTSIALPASNHHHHHDLRLLKSCRVTPIMNGDEDDDKTTTNNDYNDEDDVDLEFSTMMMASFATLTRPSSHQQTPDTHLPSTTMFSPKRTSMPHSQSMPQAHSASPRSSLVPNMHLPPRRSMEGPPMLHSLSSQESPKVHPTSAPSKKSSRMPRSPLLRVLGRPALPDSSSARLLEQLPILRSPSAHVTSRRSPMSSTARAKDRPSIPQSPSTRRKGSSKTPPSPSIRAMGYPSTAPQSSSSKRALETQVHSPSSRAGKSAHGLSTLPLICASSGLNSPLAKAVNVTSAPTYQPLCCNSGTCILECHEVETSQKAGRKPQAIKKQMKYGMTIRVTKDGSRGGRRLSFKNGRWITDDSDFVVLELK